MSSALLDRNYWQQTYAGLPFHQVAESNPLAGWLRGWLPRGRGSALEIGCYPGHFLSLVGSYGYELHGIDFVSGTDTALPAWLSEMGHQVGAFHRADFATWVAPRAYDLVCSFGFIEHFIAWPRMLEKHAALVAPGGYLLVSTPNYLGSVQRLLHLALDRGNLDRHVLDAMRPDAWADLVRQRGFEVLQQGHIGRFKFWCEDQPRNLAQRAGLRLLGRANRILRALPAGRASYAPFCVLVARRPG